MTEKMPSFLSVPQAADRLKVSARRVRALIASKRLPAQKIGRDWLINESDLKLISSRKSGAPLGNKNALGNPAR